MKKTAMLLAFVLILTAVLFSCGEKPKNEKTEDEGIIIAKDGKCNYTVIYPDKSTDAEKSVALYIRDILSSYTGATVEVKTDWIMNEDEYDPNTKEILVGNTARSESSEPLSSDIKAAVSGSKIVINGKDGNSLYYAVGVFVSRYIKNAENDVVKIPNDLKIEENVQTADGWMLYAMPVMDGVSFGEHSASVTNAFDKGGSANGKEYATVQYFDDVERSELDAYTEKLESYGFVIDSRSENGGRCVLSLFRACAGRGHRYTLTLTEADGLLSISQIVPFGAG